MSGTQNPSHDPRTDGERVPHAPERGDLPPLRSFNVIAVFDDGDAARRLILDLERAGIDGRFISAVELTRGSESPGTVGASPDHEAGLDPEVQRHEAQDEDAAFVHDVGVEGAKGGVIGGVLGALGGTAVALAIPGLGLAVGAGILGVAAGGAVAGTGVGVFAGAVSHTPASHSWERALVDFGHDELAVGIHTDDADVFEQGVALVDDAGARRVRRVGHDGELL